jgi:Co/Zn/Cd efflux system component
MQKTTFEIPGMDCPSEEALLRMKLDGMTGITTLEFDLQQRTLAVYHSIHEHTIEQALHETGLGVRKVRSEAVEASAAPEHREQRRVLWTVLGINLAFFIIEMTTGLLSGSMGLVADSLDMLADSFVYGISLYAVGGTLVRKKRIASLAGYVQLALALAGFAEVLRRFIGAESMPDFRIMIIVSLFALVANSYCLYLLMKSKGRDEAHMKASMIFTSNDVIINIGVIAAGVSVFLLESGLPDLIVGSIVFLIVSRGAMRILSLGK